MNFKLETINDFKISVPKLEAIDTSKLKSKLLFPTLSFLCYIVAKKNSGKTTVIYNIIKNATNKDTKVFLFVPTAAKDNTYKEIQKYLDGKEIEFEIFDSLDTLKETVHSLRADDEKKGEKKKDEFSIIKYKTADNEVITIKKRKQRKLAPKYLFVFDDISSELKNPALCELFKTHRHMTGGCSIICSSQHVYDLACPARVQLDYILLFGGIQEKRLDELYKNIDLSINFDSFYEMYKDATADKYEFLYIDRCKNQYRKNFNKQYGAV